MRSMEIRTVAWTALLVLAAIPVHATSPSLEATYNTSISNGWVQVERWRDPGSAFTQEAFPPDGRGNQSGQRVTFFNAVATPHSSRFLLYYATGRAATWPPGLCALLAARFL